MKRILSVLMIAAVFGLCGCSLLDIGKRETESDEPPAQTEQPVQTEQSAPPKYTMSGEIGAVNGVIYSVRETMGYEGRSGGDIPTCRLLPVQPTAYREFSSFCYYDGYVYYIETEEGSDIYSTRLCRCRDDWSGCEVLHDMVCARDGSQDNGARYFTIGDNVLYLGDYGYDGAVTTIDLTTLAKGKDYMPQFYVDVNGVRHRGDYSDDYGLYVFNDMLFYIDNANNLYQVTSDGNRFLAAHAFFDGGVANDYLYYAEYDWETSQTADLYRINLTTGEREPVDSRMPAGGGGPYFCW